MKIGIITFHASHNYGSVLQAWALQRFLENFSHQVTIVNYRSRIQRHIYHRPLEFRTFPLALSSVKRLLLNSSSVKPLNRKWERFEDFITTRYHLTPLYKNIEDLTNGSHGFDCLICGSDQIWNTSAPDSGCAYYGNWFDGRKISYAASMGNSPWKNDGDFYRAEVRNFSAISVRERSSREMLMRSGISNDIEIVCDPTLLLSPEDYFWPSDNPLPNRPYIFFYTPVGVPTEYFAIAEKLAQETGWEIYTERGYYSYQLRDFKHVHVIPDVGPVEFLQLIRNANLVIGGSFHLQVFSILFHKDFYAINGDKDARTNHLLNELGLTDRIISLEERNGVSYSPVDDWEQVDRSREAYSLKSKLWLTSAIEE